MDAKEFARKFGMTVSELAEYTGYNRRTLYNIFKFGTGCNDHRLSAMIRLLKMKAMKDLTEQKEAADEQYRIRFKALEEIEFEKMWVG